MILAMKLGYSNTTARRCGVMGRMLSFG